MARVKRGVTAHARHKRLLQDAEGRKGTRSKLVKPAREALLHAMAYATRDRKQRKRQLRGLWIVRINAAVRGQGLTYGRFIQGLKKADIAARPQDPRRPRRARRRHVYEDRRGGEGQLDPAPEPPDEPSIADRGLDHFRARSAGTPARTIEQPRGSTERSPWTSPS